MRWGRDGGWEEMWVLREVRIKVNGVEEVGGGGGMKDSLAVGGIVRRFVRSKEWQNGCEGEGEGVGVSFLGVSCRGGVMVCAVI